MLAPTHSSIRGAVAFDVCLKTEALTDLLLCFQKCSQITRYSAANDVVSPNLSLEEKNVSP